MQTTSQANTANGNPLRRTLSCLAILSFIATATACSGDSFTGGKEDSIKAGIWIGTNDDGAFKMQFNIRPDKASVVLIPISLPCGDQTMYMFGDEPTRVGLYDGAFQATIEGSDVRPRLVITGKYTDRTHAEGTWEMSRFGSAYLDIGCPAASGTWKGSPE